MVHRHDIKDVAARGERRSDRAGRDGVALPSTNALHRELAAHAFHRELGEPARDHVAAPVPAPASAPVAGIDDGGLPGPLRGAMEAAFEADFSAVRLHVDSARARSIGAVAFTQGEDIHVAPGAYSPDSAAGQALLGHELTHVVQQRAGRVRPWRSTRVNFDPTLEAEADSLGASAARGQRVHVPGSAGATRAGPGGEAVIQGQWDIMLKAVLKELLLRSADKAGAEEIRKAVDAMGPEIAAQARKAMEAAAKSDEIKAAVKQASAQLAQLNVLKSLADCVVARAFAAGVAVARAEMERAVEQIKTDFKDLLAQRPDLAALIPEAVKQFATAVEQKYQDMAIIRDSLAIALEGVQAGISELLSNHVRESIRTWSQSQAVEVTKELVRGAKDSAVAAVTPLVADLKESTAKVVESATAAAEAAKHVVDDLPSLPIPGRRMLKKAADRVVRAGADQVLGSKDEIASAAAQAGKDVQRIEEALGADVKQQAERIREQAIKNGEVSLVDKLSTVLTVISYLEMASDLQAQKDAQQQLRLLLRAGAGYVGASAGGSVALATTGVGAPVGAAMGSMALTRAVDAFLDRVPVEDLLLWAARPFQNDKNAFGKIGALARYGVWSVSSLWSGVKDIATDGLHAVGVVGPRQRPAQQQATLAPPPAEVEAMPVSASTSSSSSASGRSRVKFDSRRVNREGANYEQRKAAEQRVREAEIKREFEERQKTAAAAAVAAPAAPSPMSMASPPTAAEAMPLAPVASAAPAMVVASTEHEKEVAAASQQQVMHVVMLGVDGRGYTESVDAGTTQRSFLHRAGSRRPADADAAKSTTRDGPQASPAALAARMELAARLAYTKLAESPTRARYDAFMRDFAGTATARSHVADLVTLLAGLKA